ncbi:MAG TPA: YdcF family protein [Sandaracinaceae bacterium LLY-WYZ-13_1]|nr:YdcF family protein [Sandaracinaceae bacterium LLY-WYZ-13_1]
MLFALAIVGLVVSLRLAWRHRRARGWRRVVALGTPAGVAALAVASAPRGYLLTKSLGALAMPMGVAWVALAGLALGAWWRERPRLAALFGVGWLLVGVAGNDAIAEGLVDAVEGEHAWSSPFDRGPFDAVVVLGGGTTTTPGGVPELGASGDRVVLGARLYHRGATPRLVTSGSPIDALGGHDSVAATTRIWGELGVPREAVVQVHGARTTSEEAVHHARLIEARGWTRVGLVTSARHMRRALANFEREGVEVVPLPADVRSRGDDAMRWRGFYTLVPKGSSAADIHRACWEIVGRAAGR